MQRTWRLTATAMAMGLTLAGCASYPDAAHPMSQGWRVAHIDHELASDESTPLVPLTEDCRAQAMQAGAPARWVMLHFRRPPQEVFRVAALNEGVFKEGDEVYVRVDSCDVPLVRREPLRSGTSSQH